MIIHNEEIIDDIYMNEDVICNVYHNDEKVYERYADCNAVGELPLMLKKSRGKDLVDYSITGNTVQNGTPTPEQPVEVLGIGDKTINICPSLTTENFSYGIVRCSCRIENETLIAVGRPSEESNDTAFTFYTKNKIFLKSGDYTLSLDIYSDLENPALQSAYTTTSLWSTGLRSEKSKTVYGTSTKYFKSNEWVRISMTINIPDDDYYIIRIASDLPNLPYDKTVMIKNVQLEKGTEPSPYEPYGYKIPVLCRGKNLFNFETVKSALYGFTIDKNLRKVYANVNQDYYFSLGIIDKLSNFKGKDLVFSAKSNIDAYKIRNTRFITCDINGNNRSNIGSEFYTNNGYASCSVSDTESSDLYLAVRFYANEAIGEYVEFTDIQLEIGDKPTDYEPYTETTTTIYLPTPLMKDEILKSDGTRDVKWGVKVLDGTEHFSKNNSETDNYLYFCKRSIIGNVERVSVACTHLPKSAGAPIRNIGINANNSYDVVYFNFGEEVMSEYGNTVIGLQSFLKSEYDAGHPVTVWYPLPTPTTESITNEPVKTLSGDCYLETDTEVQPTNMSVTYKSTPSQAYRENQLSQQTPSQISTLSIENDEDIIDVTEYTPETTEPIIEGDIDNE